MDRKKYLAKNTALFALNSIGTRLITFLLVPLYTKAFSTSEYGSVDLVATIATILVPIITLNIGEAVMRFSLDENADSDNIVNVGIIVAILSMVLGTSVFAVLQFFPQIAIDSRVVYLFCITQGIYQIASCNLRGKEKLLNFAIGNIIASFLSAILNIIFLTIVGLGVNGYFAAYIISYLVASLYCIFHGDITSSLRHLHIDKILMKQMIVYSIVLVPNSLMWWVMNSSDHIMVTAMIGIGANGIYAVSYKLPSILSTFSTVFNQAWSYSAIREDKSKDRETFNNEMFDKLLSFLSIVTVALMMVMRPFMSIYVSEGYFDAWKYTPYLLLGNFFLTLGTFLSTFYTVNKDSKGFLFSGTTGAFMNIILNWLIIPVIGIHGAALATCISYISVFVYRAIDTRRYIKIYVLKKKYVSIYILLIASALMMFIPGVLSQLALSLVLLCSVIINRNFMFECVGMIRSLIRKVVKH